MTLEELNTHLRNDYSAMVERDYETAKKLNQNCGEPIYEYFIAGSKNGHTINISFGSSKIWTKNAITMIIRNFLTT